MNKYTNCKKCTSSILFFGIFAIMLSAFLSTSCEPGAEVKYDKASVNKTNIETVNFAVDGKKVR